MAMGIRKEDRSRINEEASARSGKKITNMSKRMEGFEMRRLHINCTCT
jgi:hypothetical protein